MPSLTAMLFWWQHQRDAILREPTPANGRVAQGMGVRRFRDQRRWSHRDNRHRTQVQIDTWRRRCSCRQRWLQHGTTKRHSVLLRHLEGGAWRQAVGGGGSRESQADYVHAIPTRRIWSAEDESVFWDCDAGRVERWSSSARREGSPQVVRLVEKSQRCTSREERAWTNGGMIYYVLFSFGLVPIYIGLFVVIESSFHSSCSSVLCHFFLYSCLLNFISYNMAPIQFLSSYLPSLYIGLCVMFSSNCWTNGWRLYIPEPNDIIEFILYSLSLLSSSDCWTDGQRCESYIRRLCGSDRPPVCGNAARGSEEDG